MQKIRSEMDNILAETFVSLPSYNGTIGDDIHFCLVLAIVLATRARKQAHKLHHQYRSLKGRRAG